MFDIDEILTIGEVIEHHDNLVASIDQLLKGIKSLRGSGDALAGIDKDQRLPVQLLYKEYEKLVNERESLLNQVIIRTK